ncbi:MAG: histidine kinase [Cyanobacteria bacterium CRU_2_1]|nr:histidine kinase [Cyanobacteria bacterium CRU_2_1]
MSDPISVKERVSTDLQKAKVEGSLRADRIKGIVQTAVSEAIAEFKAGSQELRSIAQDAITAVVETLGEKSKDVKEGVAASVEGVIEGISESRRKQIAETQAQVDQLQAQIDEQEQQLESDIDGALTQIEVSEKTASHDLKSLIATVVNAMKERDEFATLRQQYAKLRTRLELIDANLAARYGDRYEEVKQHLENAKAWYDNAKARAESGGVDPVQARQTEFEAKMGEAGAALARKEAQVKQRLKELLKSVTRL